MRAVLLCAGFATRLYPLTRDRAKPLLPVAGRPVIEHLVRQILGAGGFDEIVVVANRRFHADFEAWAESLRASLGAVGLRVLDDGATSNDNRLGAVRDLDFALAHTEPAEGTLVAAGDNLFRFDLGELVADFRRAPRNLVVVHEESDPERLRRTGVVEIDGQGRILRFWEKPANPPTTTCSTPLYLLRPDALALLAPFLESHPDADAPGHFISFLASEVEVYAHRMQGERLDLGDLETYRRAEAWWAGEGNG